MIQAGEPIGGRYHVVRPIERGIAGTRFHARDTSLDRDVVVTVLAVDLDRAGARERFAAEIGRMVALEHPSLAAVYGYGEHRSSPYIVSEHVAGEPLGTVAGRDRSVRLEAILEWMDAICAGVAYLHERGVVHGALAPGSILIDAQGRPRILDTGIVPLLRALGAEPIDRGDTIGYTAPEVIRGDEPDARADVFALGAVCFELLASAPPFGEGSPREVAERVLRAQPVAPLRIDADLASIVLSAMEKDPALRFRDAREIGAALASWLTGERPRGAPVPGGGAASAPGGAGFDAPRRGTADDTRTGAEPPPPPHDPALDGRAASASKGAGLDEVLETLVLEAPLSRAAPPPAGDRDVPSPALDENVQFTVFRPNAITPGVWHTMLVFAHLSERRPDAPPDEPDPLEEVRRQAEAVLGDTSEHGRQTVDSLEAVPREGELTFVPRAEGVEFNPPTRSFRWVESVHREEFRLRAAPTLQEGVVRGRLSVYLGSIILAEIPLTLRIEAGARRDDEQMAAETARRYRRVFASYSHLDRAIVEEFSEYARAIGDRYLRDVIDLRAGERWQPALEALIRQADVFQLFWSWNALASPHVRHEWQYALALQRPFFIRPVYWDEPLPAQGDLPPDALRALHFERIRPRHLRVPAPATGARVARPPAVTRRPAEEEHPSLAEKPGGTMPEPHDGPPAPFPAHAARPEPRARATRWRWPALGSAAAAILVLAIAFPMWLQRGIEQAPTDPADTPPVAVEPEPGSLPPPPPPPPPPPQVTESERFDVPVTVRRAPGAQPLAGVRVELVSDETGATFGGVTDASGSAVLTGVPPGAYRVTVTQGERTVLAREVRVSGNQTIDLEVRG